MIIKSIEMKNFFRILDSGLIEFEANENKNVTIIKGDNGTGKTTMLSAFSWVFYNEVEDPLTIDKMLNKRCLYKMNIGDIETASVRVKFVEKKHTYIVSRSQQFKKVDEGETVRIGDSKLVIFDTMNPETPIEDRYFIESMIPKDLKGFFFFDGERIDRLAKIDGREEIKKAILDILGLTTLEKLDKVIGDVKRDFNKEVKKASKSNNVQELTDEYERLGQEKVKIKEALSKAIERITVATQQISESNNFLREHNAAVVKALQAQRDSLNGEKQEILKNIQEDEKKTLKHVSKNLKYVLLADKFDEISDFLEEKRKKKELPSDIKEQFVRDLLESKECICGASLIEGEEAYSKIKKLLETAGHEELDNAYITMRAFIDSNEINETIKTFFDKLNAHTSHVLESNLRIEEIDGTLKEIGKKLQNDFGDLIAHYEALLEEAEKTRDDSKIEEVQKKHELNKNKSDMERVETLLQLENNKKTNANMFTRAFDSASQLEKLNEEIRALFVDITREDMDQKIKTVFAELSRKDDREACLNEDFCLSINNKRTKKAQILSTGERQITSLAFIGALVAYSKEKMQSDLITDFSGGDFPIVMDSPFGNLDPTHKANVAKGLPQLASQIIMIISDEQWSGTVEENIRERVCNIYNMFDGEHDGKDDEYTEFRR